MSDTENQRELLKLRHLSALQGKGVSSVVVPDNLDVKGTLRLWEKIGEGRWVLGFPIPVTSRRIFGHRPGQMATEVKGGDKLWFLRSGLMLSEFDALVALSRSLGVKLPIVGPKSKQGAVTALIRAIAQGKLSIAWVTKEE